MNHFSATELSRMRVTQETAMQDSCYILRYLAVDDAWGNSTPTYTTSAEVACGFRHLSPREIQESGLVPDVTSEVRLAADTALDPRDRVRIIKRYDETWVEGLALDTEDYEVVGPVKRGPSGLVVNLRTVQDGK